MLSTFDVVAGIIAMTCNIPRETIKPDSHLFNDLGIDSLDLMDLGFGVDDAFGIRIPIDQWLHAVHMKTRAADRYFVVRELCRYIDNLMMDSAQ
ncbi:MAG TPA: acyl carrier protein [Ktedonobacterales bacterium]|nr:acyl carrier protein [Ktedonobacterales bacterium]